MCFCADTAAALPGIQVLDPIQHARAMVASYPAAVDMLALCALLADQSGLSRSTGTLFVGLSKLVHPPLSWLSGASRQLPVTARLLTAALRSV